MKVCPVPIFFSLSLYFILLLLPCFPLFTFLFPSSYTLDRILIFLFLSTSSFFSSPLFLFSPLLLPFPFPVDVRQDPKLEICLRLPPFSHNSVPAKRSHIFSLHFSLTLSFFSPSLSKRPVPIMQRRYNSYGCSARKKKVKKKSVFGMLFHQRDLPHI